MRRFSLFEHIGYGDEFWNEAEDKPSGRPVCPTCNTDGLEKEERMDGRQDVWRCRNCKSRTADGNLNKAAGSDSNYYTLKFSESEFGGLFDTLTLARREQIANDEDIDNIFDELELIYSDGADEEGKYVLRINGDEWDFFREIYEILAEYGEPDIERVKTENDDLSFKDIIDSEEVFMRTLPDPSSEANLEDIPTRNVGPEEERPGLFEDWQFETNPAPDKPEGSALDPSTPAAKAFAAGNCPGCGFPTTPDSTNPDQLRCSNCGWEGNQPPALSEAAKEVGELEQQFELPSVQHPLGPHTGSSIAHYCENCNYTFENNQIDHLDTTCPECGGPLKVATAIGIPPSMPKNKETFEQYPDDLERRIVGSTQELYTSGSFVKGPDGRWLVAINPAGGQRDPEPGDWATIQQRSKSFNRPVPLTLVEDLGGAWKFKNGHHPSIESQVEDEAI